MTPNDLLAQAALALAAATAPDLPDYAAGAAQAKAANLPLVCWYACEPLAMSGVVRAYKSAYEQYIWVGVPFTDGYLYGRRLPAGATEADIRKVIAELRAYRPAQVEPLRNVTGISTAPAFHGRAAGC